MSTIVLIADSGDNVSILSPMTFGNPNGIAAEAMHSWSTMVMDRTSSYSSKIFGEAINDALSCSLQSWAGHKLLGSQSFVASIFPSMSLLPFDKA